MVDELDQQTIGIAKVKRPGTVAMSFGFLDQDNSKVAEAVGPDVDIIGRADNETDVIDRLNWADLVGFHQPVDCQVVAAGRQINVIRIGLPFHRHPHHFGIEIHGLTNISYIDGDVPKAKE